MNWDRDIHINLRHILFTLRIIVVCLIIIAGLLYGTLLSGCAGSNWTYNGMQFNDLKPGELSLGHVAGAVSAVIIHEASHVLVANAMGYHPYHDKWFTWRIDQPMPDSDAAIVGAAGFAGGIGFGHIMRGLGWDNDFTRAYNTTTMVEVATYPLINAALPGDGSDLDMIGRGTNEYAIWGVASALAVGLNIKKGKGKGASGQ